MDFHREKTQVYSDIVSYFGDVVMTKLMVISRTHAPPVSFYYAQLGCLLCEDNQYIIAVVENDHELIGNTEKLSSLPWISFQSRRLDQLPEHAQLSPHSFTPSVTNKNSILFDKIHLAEKRDDRWVYHSQQFPIQVELLIEKEDDRYSESGTIRSALDTFSCSMTFLI